MGVKSVTVGAENTTVTLTMSEDFCFLTYPSGCSMTHKLSDEYSYGFGGYRYLDNGLEISKTSGSSTINIKHFSGGYGQQNSVVTLFEGDLSSITKRYDITTYEGTITFTAGNGGIISAYSIYESDGSRYGWNVFAIYNRAGTKYVGQNFYMGTSCATATISGSTVTVKNTTSHTLHVVVVTA